MIEQRSSAGIRYVLKRNRAQKSLRLHIDSNQNVIVSAPYYASLSEIDDFVKRSSSWIEKRNSCYANHSYNTGDFVPYLGNKKTLMVIKGTMAKYDIIDDKIIITTPKEDTETVKKLIRQLYIDTIENLLKIQVPTWCEKLGFNVPDYAVNKAKGKWGVCYPSEKRIRISYMCATLPQELIDMVILHELCHLKHPGHGKDFWALMKANMEDLDKRKARLNELSKAGWNLNIS